MGLWFLFHVVVAIEARLFGGAIASFMDITIAIKEALGIKSSYILRVFQTLAT